MATFAVLRKLDHCFASLLSGQDIDTKEALPGFENGMRGGMTRTDMVRCKSVVEQMRVVIVDVMSRGYVEEEEEEEPYRQDTTTTEAESGAEESGANSAWGEDDESVHMDVARVYENTIVKLGEVLGDGGGIGDIS